MIKIGILTYHNTTNYGATLQAYALQNVIENFGFECEIINYQCSAVVDRYKIKKINEFKSIKQLIKYCLKYKFQKDLINRFNRFNEENLRTSLECYDKSNLKLLADEYDIFIVGSDQVWNLKLSGNDYTYFLDFVKEKNKKYSYAASFGYKEIPKQYLKKNIKLLNEFKYISVREIHGKDIIKNSLDKDVNVVLDPTLLLNEKDWKRISKDEERKKDYILLYIVALTPSIIKFTKKLAKDNNCDIVYVNNSYKKKLGMINIRNASPEEFLGYLKNAKYVVTSSFHGVVFSINFEKQFFFELSQSKDNFNSRLENIIDILCLRKREIINCHNNSIDDDIDYEKVNKLLENERIKSLKFIGQILENDNE